MKGPALLEQALASVRDTELDAPPSQGGWTIRELVHHIVDGDDLWKTCIKIALGNEEADFSLEWYWTQSQEAWTEHWAYRNRAPGVSLALLKANRDHVRQLLEQVPEGWHRSIRFRKADGTCERLPVGAVVAIQADHLEHHLKQIRAILAEVRSGSAGRRRSSHT